MPRPIDLKIVLRVLKARGFEMISQKGSHGKFRKRGSAIHTVIVKVTKKQIPHGTFQSILLQSGLREENFRKN